MAGGEKSDEKQGRKLQSTMGWPHCLRDIFIVMLLMSTLLWRCCIRDTCIGVKECFARIIL